MIKKNRERREYLESISIRDIVYPCYDGKLSRSTKCRVIDIDDKYIYIEGYLWGNKDINLILPVDKSSGIFYTNYEENNPTLMDCINEYLELGEEYIGDLYVLEDIRGYFNLGFTYLEKYL